MLPLQLVIGIVLVAAVLCSAIIFWLSPPVQTGKISLPTVVDDEVDEADNLQRQLLDDNDPFLVTKPEDFLDGTPVDEDKFWAKVQHTYILSFLSV